jgi:hypothetical protein
MVWSMAGANLACMTTTKSLKAEEMAENGIVGDKWQISITTPE